MKQETTLHSILSTAPAPQGLYEAVLAKVAVARIRAARIRAGVFAVITLVCISALVPVIEYTADQLYKSGFYDYTSLILSDRADFVLYWREFSLSIVESLPSVALLVLLPLAVALLWSLSRLIKNIRTAVKFA